MPALDTLPGDQRAVLQLVLGRGRSYEEIARLLKIPSAAVRDRAVAALGALGPQTGVSAEHQAMITDYLLGQLPDPVLPAARDLLVTSAPERAWARVVSAELADLASGPLPEIPPQGAAASAPAQASPDPARAHPVPAQAPEPLAGPAAAAASEPAAAAAPTATTDPEPRNRRLGRLRRRRDDGGADAGTDRPHSSRRGGALLLTAGAVALALIIYFAATSGGGSHPQHDAANSTTRSAAAPPANSAAAASATATTGAASGTATTSTATGARVVAQINLSPPSGSSKTAGIAQVVTEGATRGVAIAADNVPANTAHNAYAVWLYNSPRSALLLGFVNPGVTSNGRLSTAGNLPASASRYKYLIVTLETTGKPKTPGQVILQGPLSGV